MVEYGMMSCVKDRAYRYEGWITTQMVLKLLTRGASTFWFKKARMPFGCEAVGSPHTHLYVSGECG